MKPILGICCYTHSKDKINLQLLTPDLICLCLALICRKSWQHTSKYAYDIHGIKWDEQILREYIYHSTICLSSRVNEKEKYGEAGYRSLYLSHAKRALYHLSYIPMYFISLLITNIYMKQWNVLLLNNRFEIIQLLVNQSNSPKELQKLALSTI